MSTVALHIIAKDEIEQITRIVKEYLPFFDAIDVAVDDKDSFNYLVEKYPQVNFYLYEHDEWEKERKRIKFDKKRNFLVSKCKCDYYFRLDTDDKINNPENVRDIVEKAQKQNIECILTWYAYATDHFGNTHAAHWRETIMKVDKGNKWNKKIHENIVPVGKTNLNLALEKSISLTHLMDEKDIPKKQERNLAYLEEEYVENKENTDPRTFAYLGRMYYPMGRLKEAKEFLLKHVKTSGWDEDRLKSWIMLADIYVDEGNTEDAMSCCFEALSERPEFPDPYLKLSEVYYAKADFKKAIFWGISGLRKEVPVSTTLYDPSAYSWRPSIILAHAYMMENDIDNAKKFFDIAYKLVPTLDWMKHHKPIFDEAVEQKEFFETFVKYVKLVHTRQPELVKNLLNCIPDKFKKNEIAIKFKQDFTPAKLWENDTVEIYCGQAWEDWAAPSVINGIGGSEEAVIYLSKELVKLGWKVTVYCSCGELEGEYEGVVYRPYYEFSLKDHHNILISWRNNIFGDGVNARKKYVWTHDIMPQGTYNENNLAQLDKVIVLSEFHKEVIGVPPEKTYVSSNGVNLKDFELKNQLARNPHRMIYTSSYDRGIEHLLKRWKEVKEAVPDAELHLFYGWNTYDKMMEVGRRPRTYKDYMVGLMAQEGVFEHGRVGHKQLIKEFYKSGVYVYPSHFEEISCIAAMKAQECGCVPVVFDYAALKETVKSGIKIEGNALTDGAMDKYVKELINVLTDVDTQERLRNDIPKKIFGWDKVARDWNDNLLALKYRTYKDYEDYKSHYVTLGDFKTSNFSADGKYNCYPRYQLVLDYIKKYNLKSLLDAGCSDGVLCYLANTVANVPAHGIDADKKTIEFCNKYAQEFNLNSKFTNCILEEFTSEEKFGCASALEIIEHVIDPKVFLTKLESFVEEGGYIILSTPNKDGYYGEKNFNEQHINLFTKDTLEELIGKERIVEWKDTGDILLVVYKK